jgi:hypothetical protein
MTYLAGSQLGGAAGAARAAATEKRVHSAVAAGQTFLVIRIISGLLLVSLLPAQLPTITLRLDPTNVLTLPLSVLSGGSIVLIVAAISAIELYLVYRLADRWRSARTIILIVEALAILATSSALALGSIVAALPLATSVGGTALLLLNQVRWAFRLEARRSLTGRRQGGVYAGYAAPPLDTPKPPQAVGYTAGRTRQG